MDMRQSILLFILLITSTVFSHSLAQDEANPQLSLSKKIAVFPISDISGTEAEEAWWKMRELLTQESRFLVATRRLMINRGVFQGRRLLKPADAILLSKILDADLVFASFIQDRIFHINVYEGDSGQIFYSRKIDFHPAIPIKEQVSKITTQGVKDFLSYLPYDGYIVKNDLKGTVFSTDGEVFSQAKIFDSSRLKEGDPLQVVRIRRPSANQFEVEVVAEGEFLKVEGKGISLIKLIQFKDMNSVSENSFIRVPSFRVQSQGALSQDTSANLTTEYLTKELKTKQELEKNHSATTSSVWWLVNLAAMVFLAF